jgi:hypothetical protein
MAMLSYEGEILFADRKFSGEILFGRSKSSDEIAFAASNLDVSTNPGRRAFG